MERSCAGTGWCPRGQRGAGGGDRVHEQHNPCATPPVRVPPPPPPPLTFTPDKAFTVVDFPWATCPMVPMLMVACREMISGVSGDSTETSMCRFCFRRPSCPHHNTARRSSHTHQQPTLSARDMARVRSRLDPPGQQTKTRLRLENKMSLRRHPTSSTTTRKSRPGARRCHVNSYSSLPLQELFLNHWGRLPPLQVLRLKRPSGVCARRRLARKCGLGNAAAVPYLKQPYYCPVELPTTQ